MTRAAQFIITYVPFTLSDWLVHTSMLINSYNWPHGVAFLFSVTLSALGGKSNGHVQRWSSLYGCSWPSSTRICLETRTLGSVGEVTNTFSCMSQRLSADNKAFACLSSPSRARYHVSRQIHVLRVGAVLLILHLSIFKYVWLPALSEIYSLKAFNLND
jgi:hypothetical protein